MNLMVAPQLSLIVGTLFSRANPRLPMTKLAVVLGISSTFRADPASIQGFSLQIRRTLSAARLDAERRGPLRRAGLTSAICGATCHIGDNKTPYTTSSPSAGSQPGIGCQSPG